MPASSTCSFCPTDLYITVGIDIALIDKANYVYGTDDVRYVELPAVRSAELQVTRDDATTIRHSNSAGVAVATCSSSSRSEAWVISGNFCTDFPVFYMLPRKEVTGGSPITRRFRIYWSRTVPGGPATHFWEFDATYEYGNLSIDNNATDSTTYQLTLNVSSLKADPVWDATAIDIDHPLGTLISS